MTDPVRFPAQVPYDKWPDAARCYEMMINGEWGDLQAFFALKRQNITDSIGAVNYWRNKFNPSGAMPVVGTGPNGEIQTLQIGGGFIDYLAQPGTVYCFKVNGVGLLGNASGSVQEQGQGIYAGASVQLVSRLNPLPDSFWLVGGPKAYNGLSVRHEDYVYVYQAAPVALMCRADIRKV